MGFFFAEDKKKKETKKAKKQNLGRIPKNLLREQGCKACSLNQVNEPCVPADGDADSLIYILGEMPGPREEDTGIHFKGESGMVLRKSLRRAFPDLFESKRDLNKTIGIRFNYCVQCPTPKHRQPKESEIECCRKSIEDDIQKTKPFAIIGLGPISLKWVIGYSNIDEWRGRRLPIKIGNHTCWYFPIQTPSLLKKKNNSKFKNEYEKAFDMDLQRAAFFIMDEDSPEAKVYDKDFDKGIKIFEGKSSSEFKKIEKELEKLKQESSVSIDIETNKLKPFGCKDAWILTIAIGTFENTIAFPVDHPKAWKGDEKSRKAIKDLISNFLMECRGKKSCHYLKFEAIWFYHYYGQRPLRSGIWADTMAQAYTLDQRTKKSGGMLSLDVLCLLHFGFKLKPLTDLDRKNLINAPLDKTLLYNGMDTKWTHLLEERQDALLHKSQEWTYHHLVRTATTLAVTETEGVPVDFDTVDGFSKEYQKKLEDIEAKIFKAKSVKKFGRKFGDFNPASPDSVVLLFRDILGLKSVKETSKGSYSTDDEVLKSFNDKGHKEAGLILDFREISKVKSTYIDSIDKVIYPDGLLHADYNHLFTSTGRTSSEHPNMQNYPKRKNKEIRRMIVPPEGFWFVAVDYGQLEARIIAMASQDKTFCNAIETGYDIHMEWAERILKIHPRCAGVRKSSELDEKGWKDFRQRSKNEWVFPLFFGSHFTSVANSLGLPIEKADRLVKDFWGEFKGVKNWQGRLQKFYNEHGYVETLTGARRVGPLSYNELINAPIQGTASYVVVDGMNRLSLYAYEEKKPQFQARMNIHDDLSFFIPDRSLEEDIDIISEKMSCTSFDFVNVPLAVEVSVGENWADIEEILVADTTDFE